MSITEILSYPFVIRAITVGVLVSLCGALLGVNLVLKKLSMLGDGLSHVSFGAAAIGLALGVAPLKISIPIVIIAAFLLVALQNSGKLSGDAATAVISSSALAIGLIVASLTTGMNTDINNFMFGSILAVTKGDVVICAIVSIAVIALYFVFYHKIFACAFDEQYAFSSGVNVKFYNCLTAVLTAVVVVVGMRIMGALLISSIITFPAISAMRICKKYRTTVILSCIVGVATFLLGLCVSFFLDVPSSASIVVINLFVFIIFSVIKKLKTV